MTNKIDINKSVPREQWGEFFDQFSDSNRGRRISIEMLGEELVDISPALKGRGFIRPQLES
jgi:hypothetical protein